jgi:plastocyanin
MQAAILRRLASRNMPMNLRRLAAVLLLTLCAGCSSSNTPTTSPTNGTPVSIVAGSTTLSTTAYSPNPVTVAVGGTVTWMNNDTTPHTATGDDNSYNSGTIAPGGQFSRTFSTAGSYPYHCTLHPNMVGTVRVQ